MSDVPGPLSGPGPVSALPAAAAALVSARGTTPPPNETEVRIADEKTFLQLRRKVQDAELLSASTERLLLKMHFSGRLTVVVQNGRVLKSGYEEGYFRRKNDLSGILDT